MVQMKVSYKRKIAKLVLCLGTILFLTGSLQPVYPKEPETQEEIIRAIQLLRKEKDHFFKTAHNSPLEESDKLHFKGLHYFPIDLRYRFEGVIERHIININNPKYYATFPTNKGPRKRYTRYGRFRFMLDGREYALQLYKSILGD